MLRGTGKRPDGETCFCHVDISQLRPQPVEIREWLGLGRLGGEFGKVPDRHGLVGACAAEGPAAGREAQRRDRAAVAFEPAEFLAREGVAEADRPVGGAQRESAAVRSEGQRPPISGGLRDHETRSPRGRLPNADLVERRVGAAAPDQGGNQPAVGRVRDAIAHEPPAVVRRQQCTVRRQVPLPEIEPELMADPCQQSPTVGSKRSLQPPRARRNLRDGELGLFRAGRHLDQMHNPVGRRPGDESAIRRQGKKGSVPGRLDGMQETPGCDVPHPRRGAMNGGGGQRLAVVGEGQPRLRAVHRRPAGALHLRRSVPHMDRPIHAGRSDCQAVRRNREIDQRTVGLEIAARLPARRVPGDGGAAIVRQHDAEDEHKPATARHGFRPLDLNVILDAAAVDPDEQSNLGMELTRNSRTCNLPCLGFWVNCCCEKRLE